MEAKNSLKWVEVCAAAALIPGQVFSCKLGEERLAIFLDQDKVYALRDLCPHQGALLSSGTLHTYCGAPVLICPSHLWAFSLHDGNALGKPGFQATLFPAEIRAGRVWVGLPNG